MASLIGGLLAVGLLAGCGEDDEPVDSTTDSVGEAVSADSDAQAVLDGALGAGGDPIESGVLDLSFDLASDSANGVTADASVSGPFESNEEGTLPSVDFDVQAGADAGGPTIGFEGGVTLTPDGLFVSYGGTDYQVDDPTFQLLQDGYAESAQLQADQQDEGSLSQFGIDPASWLTDVTNEGIEDIDGTQAVHIAGVADVDRIVSDLGTVAEQSAQAAAGLDTSSLQQLQDSVQDASIDLFANASDGSLRRLDVGLEVANPMGGGGTDSVTLSIGVAEPNSDQEISAPADAQPIADLLAQFPGGISSLGGLAPQAPAPPAAGGGAGDPGGNAYYECVANAPTPAAVTECAALLGSG